MNRRHYGSGWASKRHLIGRRRRNRRRARTVHVRFAVHISAFVRELNRTMAAIARLVPAMAEFTQSAALAGVWHGTPPRAAR